MDAGSRQTLKKLEIFSFFVKKRPFTVKFSKFCSEIFYRDTGRRSCVQEMLRCLPDKKIRLAFKLSLQRGSVPGLAPDNASDFIQIGSLSTEL